MKKSSKGWTLCTITGFDILKFFVTIHKIKDVYVATSGIGLYSSKWNISYSNAQNGSKKSKNQRKDKVAPLSSIYIY